MIDNYVKGILILKNRLINENKLNEEDQKKFEFVNKCINSKNEKLKDASYKAMAFDIEWILSENKYYDKFIESVHDICKDLNDEETDLIYGFIVTYSQVFISCINNYQELEQKQLYLRKEKGNDKLWQK